MAERHRRAVPEGLVAASSTIPGALARRIRMVLFDVDGVLTDAGVYIGVDHQNRTLELKRFDIQDGLGLRFLQEAGLTVAVVSGRVSEASARRAAELGVECHQAEGGNKFLLVATLLERHDVAWTDVAMLADDLPDLSVFSRVGLRAAVANAQPEIRERAGWVSTRAGGHGAAREFCRALLEARGEWHEQVRRYVEARGGDAGVSGRKP